MYISSWAKTRQSEREREREREESLGYIMLEGQSTMAINQSVHLEEMENSPPKPTLLLHSTHHSQLTKCIHTTL